MDGVHWICFCDDVAHRVYLVGRPTRFRQELFCAPRAENRCEMLLGEYAAAVQKQFADENTHLVLLIDELFAAGQ